MKAQALNPARRAPVLESVQAWDNATYECLYIDPRLTAPERKVQMTVDNIKQWTSAVTAMIVPLIAVLLASHVISPIEADKIRHYALIVSAVVGSISGILQVVVTALPKESN